MLWLIAFVLANRLGFDFQDVFYMNLTVDSKSVTAIVDTGSSTLAFPCWGCLECNHRQIRPHTKPLGIYEQCYAEGSCNRGQIHTAKFCFDAPQSICFDHEFGCCTEYAPAFRNQHADGIVGLSAALVKKIGKRYATFMITRTKAQFYFDLPDVHLRWTRPVVHFNRVEIPVLFDTASTHTYFPKRMHRGKYDETTRTYDPDSVPCDEDQTEFTLHLAGALLHIDTFATTTGRCAGIWGADDDRVVVGVNGFRNNVIVFDYETGLVGIARLNEFWPT